MEIDLFLGLIRVWPDTEQSNALYTLPGLFRLVKYEVHHEHLGIALGLPPRLLSTSEVQRWAGKGVPKAMQGM